MVLLFFIPFVLNFDVTRYFNNRLLLVVCSVHLQLLTGHFLYKMENITLVIFANFVGFFEGLYLAVNNSELETCWFVS